MKQARIVIAGGREFKDYKYLKQTVDEVIKKLREKEYDQFVIVSGTARGADKLGEKYAQEKGFAVDPYPADWDDLKAEKVYVKTNRYGKKYNALAGDIRNEKMAQNCEVVIAFWDGRSPGTKKMIEYGHKYKRAVLVFRY